MTVILRLRTNSQSHFFDFRRLKWDAFRGLSLESIQRQTLEVNRVLYSLQDWFDIEINQETCQTKGCTEDPEWGIRNRRFDADFVVKGDLSNSVGLGSCLSRSTLVVDGNVGSYAGAKLNGGTLIVIGNASSHLGHSMQSGSVCVSGNAGDDVASPELGRRSGMRGGTLMIGGNIGQRAGHKLRRGTIVVKGNCGDSGLHGMIAGTFVGLKNIGLDWGMEMKRGTLVLSPKTELTTRASLTKKKTTELSFLHLLWKHLHQFERDSKHLCTSVGLPLPATDWSGFGTSVFRQIGDLSTDGRAEVLTLS